MLLLLLLSFYFSISVEIEFNYIFFFCLCWTNNTFTYTKVKPVRWQKIEKKKTIATKKSQMKSSEEQILVSRVNLIRQSIFPFSQFLCQCWAIVVVVGISVLILSLHFCCKFCTINIHGGYVFLASYLYMCAIEVMVCM